MLVRPQTRLAIAAFAFLLGSVAATPSAEAEASSRPDAERVDEHDDPSVPGDDGPLTPVGECASEGTDSAPDWDQVPSSAVALDVRVPPAPEVPLLRVSRPSTPSFAASPPAAARGPPRA
ncbi:MAG TPA: hypothetical protein VIL20_26910 [Sandaracinaceae bacterium]